MQKQHEIEILNDIKEGYIKSIYKNFEKDKNIVPVALIVTDKFQMMCMPLNMISPDSQRQSFNNIRKVCLERNAVAVAIISEVWMVQGKIKDAEKFIRDAHKYGGVKNMPNCKESIVMVYETKSFKETIIIDIDRENQTLVNEKRVNGSNIPSMLAPDINLN